ncbi:ABC transporter substrate-binding protein [Paenibacillus sp. 481]|uniref:ABC transporter substrate-binding protein n=1 Tax=Paenibacillus sp. 481 TaxID=2835869 RepID=UPI001E38D524|nr:Fe(3+) dicitrate ABC transporter substrate-binding protein [Paenibacillus sp. 481]UHA75257.1 ABC transporter substrate-binding protein [Paenibacillus sp. 481]
MTLKKKYQTVFAILLTMLLIVGCGSQATEGGQASGNESTKKEATTESARKIKHELGEAELKGTPQRVVVLEFSFVDALASLDIKPVGIADDGKTDRILKPLADKVAGYTSVGTRKQPSLEVISSLKPDLIIADWKRHKAIYEDLKEIAPTLVLKSLEAGYDDNIASFQTIADAMNKQEEGKKRLEQHAQTLETLKAKAPATDAKQTVMSAAVRKEGFNAHTSSSYGGALFEKVGLMNAIQDPKAPYAELTLEQLLNINPDVLFLMKTDGEQTIVDEWSENPLWQQLNAVKKQQVFEVDRNLWTRWRGLVAGEIMVDEAIQYVSGCKKTAN